jgi:hypothetical protein
MFFDSTLWPPAPDGDPPPEPQPAKLTARQERLMMRIVGLLLLVLFLGPFAGSSVISAAIALTR